MPEKFEYPRIPIAPGHEACNGDHVTAMIVGEDGTSAEVTGVVCGYRVRIGEVTTYTADVALPEGATTYKDVPVGQIKKVTPSKKVEEILYP